MEAIVDLRHAAPEQAATIGNKAAGLGELIRAGFDVPRGFVLTTAAKAAADATGAMPAEVRTAVARAFAALAKPVAVRSSSPAEDRDDASFAGQYQTILGVRDEAELFAAIQACWASASADNVASYRAGHAGEDAAEMAVVVQELVPATAAGVLFTMHPVTDRIDQVVVNANFGLGESVVSGRAEPDTFVLDKASGRVVETKPGAKKLTMRMGANGLEEVEGDDARGSASLSPAQLAQLADAARRLEAHFDLPIDAEFAFAGDQLLMLQARPITTGMAAYMTGFLDDWARERGLTDDPEAIWKRGSPLSGLPVTPLYYSEMAAFFSDMFPKTAQLRGTKPATFKAFRYFRGFTYSNVTFSSAADPSGQIPANTLFGPIWRGNLKLSLAHRHLAFWSVLDGYFAKWRNDWGPDIDRNRPDYATADAPAIWRFIDYIETQRRERSVYASLAVSYAGDLLGLLTHLLREWAPNASEDTLGVLTSGVEGSLTHDENAEVWALTEHARGTAAVAQAMLAGEFARLPVLSGGADFLRAVDAMRARRPHRGSTDRDLSQPRWGDDRASLLNQTAAMLRVGESANPEHAHHRAAASREAAERRVLAEVGRGPLGPVRRRIFARVMRATQRYWIHRDNQRHTYDRYFWELRNAYRAIGRRLAEQGALSTGDDVFFAGKGEIGQAIAGQLTPARLRRRADWRRAWWAKATAAEPPLHIQGAQAYEPASAGAGEGVVRGTGGAPGIATGPVRIIRHLHELSQVQGGEVIVCHAIDPAWTPVFGTIAGVISEEGGMLSHATVLGREYGIPVVIGADGAIGALAPGVQVRIDGTRGLVSLVEEAAAAPQPAEAAS